MSRARIAATTSDAASSPLPTMACSALRTNVFTDERMGRFRRRRRSATRTILMADLVFGTLVLLLHVEIATASSHYRAYYFGQPTVVATDRSAAGRVPRILSVMARPAGVLPLALAL